MVKVAKIQNEKIEIDDIIIIFVDHDCLILFFKETLALFSIFYKQKKSPAPITIVESSKKISKQKNFATIVIQGRIYDLLVTTLCPPIKSPLNRIYRKNINIYLKRI